MLTGTPLTDSTTRLTPVSWVRVLTNCAHRFCRVVSPALSLVSERRLTVATPDVDRHGIPEQAGADRHGGDARRRRGGPARAASWARASRVASLSTGNHRVSGTRARWLVET